MLERVSVIENDSLPLVLVCPHGPDDTLTDLITEELATRLGCFAVINRGFKRAQKVDVLNDVADCNNVQHCHEDVVKEEFLDPFMKFVNRCVFGGGDTDIIIVHGLGSKARQTEPNLDMVLGFGAGRKHSESCSQKRKNLMLYLLHQRAVKIYQGKAGGKYAGASSNNLNQLYRKHYEDHSVHSQQLEIIWDIRSDEKMAALVVDVLYGTIKNYMDAVLSGKIPGSFSANWESIAEGLPEFG